MEKLCSPLYCPVSGTKSTFKGKEWLSPPAAESFTQLSCTLEPFLEESQLYNTSLSKSEQPDVDQLLQMMKYDVT